MGCSGLPVSIQELWPLVTFLSAVSNHDGSTHGGAITSSEGGFLG